LSIQHVFYLHGFASSPHSTQAAALGNRLARFGITLQTPDFNQPDFSTLTVSRMLDQLDHAVADLTPGPVALIGSSLGGFVAVHGAARQRPSAEAPITQLILLAPAFEFGRNRIRDLAGMGVEQWKATDRLEVFHYGYGAMRPIRYALFEDAQRYDSYALKINVPTVIIYGTRDESVSPTSVERWARGRSNVRLRPVNDGHELTTSLDIIWDETAKALGIEERYE
jgi:pimeloyl-ACP methyl ester carboxylesterase